MQLLVPIISRIMVVLPAKYHKTYEYTRGTSLVDLIWAGTVDLEVFQTGKIL